MTAELLTGVLRRDRAVVLACLAAVIAAAWAYLWFGVGLGMPAMEMGGRMMAMPPAWTPGYAALIFLMWAAMMAAMMLPTPAPTVLLVASLARRRSDAAGFTPATALVFASGYLLVWFGISLVATSLQWALYRAGMLRMAIANAAVAGVVMIAAGLWQWKPLKDTCLRHCRSPVGFLVGHWRPGIGGAAAIGMRHGLYCLGCCWMLMALLFVAGLMNFAWIAAIALFVLLEKTTPWGGRTPRVTGALLALWGVVVLVRNF
jgi:predicted metal-binding membrane protein